MTDGDIRYLIIDGGIEAISAEVMHGLLERHPGLIIITPQEAEQQGISCDMETVTQITANKRFEISDIPRVQVAHIPREKLPYSKGKERKRQTDFKQRMREAMKKRR